MPWAEKACRCIDENPTVSGPEKEPKENAKSGHMDTKVGRECTYKSLAPTTDPAPHVWRILPLSMRVDTTSKCDAPAAGPTAGRGCTCLEPHDCAAGCLRWALALGTLDRAALEGPGAAYADLRAATPSASAASSLSSTYVTARRWTPRRQCRHSRFPSGDVATSYSQETAVTTNKPFTAAELSCMHDDRIPTNQERRAYLQHLDVSGHLSRSTTTVVASTNFTVRRRGALGRNCSSRSRAPARSTRPHGRRHAAVRPRGKRLWVQLRILPRARIPAKVRLLERCRCL